MRLLGWLLWFVLLRVAAAGGVEDAEALLRAQRPGAAMTQLRAWLRQHPEDTPAHELYIDILLNAGLASEARRLYNEYVSAHPADADAWYLLGRAVLDPDDAQRALTRALEIDPDHARALMGWGALARALGEHEEARQRYLRAVELDPSLAEAWIGLWTSQYALGDRRGAAQTAASAARAVPDTPEPWLALAGLQPDRARAHYEAGLARCPGEARLTSGYARQTFLDHDLEAARAAYAAAIQATPDDPALRVEAAMLEEIRAQRLTWDGAQGLIDARGSARASPETMRRLDGVVGQHPRSALARVVRGNLRQMLGQTADALADLEAAAALEPDSDAAQAALGLLLLEQRRPAEAIPHLQAAVAQRPYDVALAIAAAIALAEGRDAGAGGLALLELQEQFPYSPGPPLALAQLLMGMGEPERAMSILSEAAARIPEAQLMLALAAAAKAAGRPAEAARVLETLGEQTGDPRFLQAARQLLEGTEE